MHALNTFFWNHTGYFVLVFLLILCSMCYFPGSHFYNSLCYIWLDIHQIVWQMMDIKEIVTSVRVDSMQQVFSWPSQIDMFRI